MNMLTQYLITILIVGFVTAGLNIKFDRFFTIFLLLFIFTFSIFNAVNIFLWIIMLGALMILFQNKDKIAVLPKPMNLKLFILVPLLTFVATYVGSLLFNTISSAALIFLLGVIAVLYGLRLILIHFKPHEIDLQNANPLITRICGFFGPLLSGFTIGLIGTSLKPLKIPFAIRVGKMNAKQVYLGNTITTFFASVFAIMWHALFQNISSDMLYNQVILGIALWAGIHIVFEITHPFFPNKLRQPFQVFIGIVLIIVAMKVFLII